MFGLLGPNGAGKTTLMRILVTLMKQSEGRVLVNGLDIEKDRKSVRAMIGYLPQEFSTFSKLSTWEFLDYSARLAGLKKRGERASAVDAMLERVGLFDVRDRAANKLSGGMKRRLGIAQALIGNPRLIIVDEPTTGLDPEERLRFRNILTELSQRDVTIILSTHIVGDISSTCNRMALLVKGSVAFSGPPEDLIERARGHVWLVDTDDEGLRMMSERYAVVSTVPDMGGWEVQVVAEKLNGFNGREIDPNLEHAYVYFMEYIIGESIVETAELVN
jgi:ABC-type multidrug transport system ATPase subunit